jgi:hypothetical protein
MFQRIKDQGYSGGHAILQEYVRKVRPQPASACIDLLVGNGDAVRPDVIIRNSRQRYRDDPEEYKGRGGQHRNRRLSNGQFEPPMD